MRTGNQAFLAQTPKNFRRISAEKHLAPTIVKTPKCHTITVQQQYIHSKICSPHKFPLINLNAMKDVIKVNNSKSCPFFFSAVFNSNINKKRQVQIKGDT